MSPQNKIIATVYPPAQAILPHLAVVLADDVPIFVAPAETLEGARDHLRRFFTTAETHAQAARSVHASGAH